MENILKNARSGDLLLNKTVGENLQLHLKRSFCADIFLGILRNAQSSFYFEYLRKAAAVVTNGLSPFRAIGTLEHWLKMGQE